MLQKGFSKIWILVAVAVVAAVVVVGVLVYQQLQEPAGEVPMGEYNDWQIYDSQKFSIIFNYPQDWFLKGEYGNDYDKRIVVSNIESSDIILKEGETAVAFEVYPNKKNNKIDDIIFCKSLGAVKLITCGEEKINEVEFKKQTFSTTGGKSLHLAAIRKGMLYQIQAFGDIDSEEVWQIIRSAKIRE